MIGLRITILCSILALEAWSSTLHAQANARVDLAATYTAERGNPVGTGGNFWLQGGSFEAGVTVWRGLAVAGNFTGVHTKTFGPSAIPLGLLSYGAGPRYRFTPRLRSGDTSIFGEALFGGVHGFDSIFPNQAGQSSTADAFAVQLGGGIDVRLNSRFAVRPVEAGWVRTHLPNATTNVQNDLRLSSGVVVRFGHTN